MMAPISFGAVLVAPEAPSSQVICDALILAAIATRLRIEWHAGLIDADTAMKELDSMLSELCALRHKNQAVAAAGSDPIESIQERRPSRKDEGGLMIPGRLLRERPDEWTRRAVIGIAAARYVVVPAVLWVAVAAFGASQIILREAVLTLTLSIVVAVAIFAVQYKQAVREMASIAFVSTVRSIFTVAALIAFT